MARLRDILKATNIKLKTVQRDRERSREELDRLERDEEKFSNIRGAVIGLETTRKRVKERNYDPGKYDTAYFYCKSIDQEDIEHSNRPKLYEKCPDCGEKNPVLMSYEQTYDSPEGDLWTKIAFSICICGNYNEIKKITKEDRFL